MITYGEPSKKSPTGRKQAWQGIVEMARTADGRHLVTVRLTNWRTYNDDINCRKEFVTLRQALVEHWAAIDPQLRTLDEGAE